MSRKTSQRFAKPSPANNSFGGDLPPVGDLSVDSAAASSVPLNRQLLADPQFTQKPKVKADVWSSTADDELPPVDVAESEEQAKPAPPPVVLIPVPLEELPQQWDNFMESLPRKTRDKVYDSGLSTMLEILSKPKQQLMVPRGPFLPQELEILASRFESLGHPLTAQVARSSQRQPGMKGSMAQRREQLRMMRRD